MNQQMIDNLASRAGDVPAQLDVVALRQHSLDELQERGKRFIALVGEKETQAGERGDWRTLDGQTAVLLTKGARATLYHPSGTLKYTAGLQPLQALFVRAEDKDPAYLTRLVNEAAKKFDINAWAGTDGKLVFERLWQVKAQGADRNARLSDEVLCRVVGAYRHFVNGTPVLGEASVALKLAGNGALDMLSVAVRDTTSELVDKARIIDTELAAKQIFGRLESVLGHGKQALASDQIESQTLRFGYLNLGKRSSQRLLAPVFMAQLVVRHKEERQAYLFAVAATEKAYLPLERLAVEATPEQSRPAAALGRTLH